MEPDLEGFRDANVRLREAVGAPLTFYIPQPEAYPPGTVLDIETGKPYDPVIEPVASGVASASAIGIVVLPGATDRAATEVATAIGNLEAGEAAVVVSADEYDSRNLEAATQVQIYDEVWSVVQRDRDGIGREPPDRVIIHARQG